MPPSETQVKAPGLFNWRLKWRCRFPTDGVEFLLRLGVWDENTLSPNQAHLFARSLLSNSCSCFAGTDCCNASSRVTIRNLR